VGLRKLAKLGCELGLKLFEGCFELLVGPPIRLEFLGQ